MPTSFFVTVLGSVFGVELDESVPADVRSAIAAQWAHLQTSGVEPAERFRLTLSPGTTPGSLDAKTVSVASPGAAPDTLAGALTVEGLHRLAGQALMFHAAGLAYDDGAVIALIGPSGRGKTTACRQLGHRFGYVSDETVAFRPDLSVIAYPKPLSVGSRPGTKDLHAPGAAGMKPAPDELHLAALVLLDRSPTVVTPAVEPVRAIDALGELVAQTSSLDRLHRPLQTLLEVINATGGVRRLRYADGHDLEVLATGIARVRGEVETWSVPEIVAAATEVPEGAIARADFADAVVLDERLVVLGSGRMHILDGIGPAVWQNAGGVGGDELEARIVEEYGSAPAGMDVESVVAAAVDQLIDAGLLRRG